MLTTLNFADVFNAKKPTLQSDLKINSILIKAVFISLFLFALSGCENNRLTQFNPQFYVTQEMTGESHALSGSTANSQSPYKPSEQYNQISNLIHGSILAMFVFNLLLFLYTRKIHHLLFTVFSLSYLYALLWQTGNIIHWPKLSWPILGANSQLVFAIIADATAILFIYHFMRLKFAFSWWVKLMVLCVAFRFGLMLTALIQYHGINQLNIELLSKLNHISLIISTLLVWVFLAVKTSNKFSQAKYVFFGWSLLVLTFMVHLYISYIHQVENTDFAFEPGYRLGTDLISLTIVIIWAFAAFIRNLEADETSHHENNSYSAIQQAAQRPQLISQFQDEMHVLVKDPTLSLEEVTEKINIKFHLLINKAFPIKNSMLHTEEGLKGICTTGLKPLDIDLVEFKLKKILGTETNGQASQFEITTANNKVQSFLYIPLNNNQTHLVLGLKKNQPIDSVLLAEFRSYCEIAYNTMIDAREVHQIAMAANLDPLTGCYNRKSIEKIIDESLKNANRTTLASLSIKGLNQISHQYGQSTSDQCVIDFIGSLKDSLKDRGKLGRLKASEYIVVFSDVTFELCEELLESFLISLTTHQFTSDQLSLTAYVGLAESRINETQNSLLKKAELANKHAMNKTEKDPTNDQSMGQSNLSVYLPSIENEAGLSQ